ncbi:unnamed protein product [Calicophoron daubneyi]|uniref:Uncharacterized protein n=1 Tax=Calicophoron daubneyi TaxID=300641 RepID=A0AAV2TUU6_CALDB
MMFGFESPGLLERYSSFNEENLKESVTSLRQCLDGVTKQISSRASTLVAPTKSNRNLSSLASYKSEANLLKRLDQEVRCAQDGAELLASAIECLEIVENFLSCGRKELRKLSRENREIKAGISYCIEKVYDSEGQLAASKEEAEFWKFMCSLAQLDYELTLTSDDIEIWMEPKRFDNLWNPEYASYVASEMNDIFEEVEGAHIKKALTMIDLLPASDILDHPTQATLVEKIARRFFEGEHFQPCLVLLEKVLNLRKKAYGNSHPIVSASLNCQAVTYSRLKQGDEAAKLALEALRLVEKHPRLSKDKEAMAGQYIRTGQMFVSCGHPQDGVRIMQQAASLLSEMLPREELRWCAVINRMTRTCNDNGFFDDAMALGCQVVDYYQTKYYGMSSDRNPVIYEIAYAHQVARQNPKFSAEDYPLPAPTYLNRSLSSALKEISIAFASRHEFRAAQIVASYLRKCSSVVICEPDPVGIFYRGAADSHTSLFLSPKLITPRKNSEPGRKSMLKSLSNLLRGKK